MDEFALDLGELDDLKAGLNAEAEKLQELEQAEALRKQIEPDDRSIYVGNIPYDASSEHLKEWFNSRKIGDIIRCTIILDQDTMKSKGYGYVELGDLTSLNQALALDQEVFIGRRLRIVAKRRNLPGFEEEEKEEEREKSSKAKEQKKSQQPRKQNAKGGSNRTSLNKGQNNQNGGRDRAGSGGDQNRVSGGKGSGKKGAS